MDINKIRVKYTLALCSIAFFFIILVSMNYLLVAKTEQGLAYFGSNFNPAISAVINADRDLYQAKVAELNVLQSSPSNQKIAAFYAEYEENAKQAYDRMLLYKKLMAMYPENIRQLNRFDSAFKAWKQESDKVFALVRSNDLAGAKLQSDGASDAAFNELREFYNIAGEIADKTSSEVSEQTISSVVRSQVILTVISTVIVALTLFTGIAAPKAMADALENLSSKLKELNSGDGDLTKRIHTNRKDEIGQVANDFDELINGIAELIRSFVEQSADVIDGVGELDSGAKRIKGTSEEQLTSVDMIVTAVNQMSYAIKEVAQNAQLTSNELQKVNELTQTGSQITTDAVKEIKGLSETVNQASEVIAKLSENSKDISSVIDVIRGIAEQTNLLALNAAIEAARAGEQGRGFAVVADEVRSLASKTQQSTESINDMIESLQADVEDAVSSISQGNSATLASVELSEKTLDALNQIDEAALRVSDLATQTATATEEQSQVADDVSKNLTLMSEQTKTNHEESEHNKACADNTMTLATNLSDSVTRFKLP